MEAFRGRGAGGAMTGRRWFDTTKWSLVLAAREPRDEDSRAALATLCETYWPPLYAFVRRQGFDPDEALDLTQAYFLKLMERDFLRDARPELGRFRTFLLASVKHHIANEKRRDRAVRRGGDREILALDGAEAERRLRAEPVDARTPEHEYERRWALTVVSRTRERLRGELEAEGKGGLYAALAPTLVESGPARPYRDIAAELGASEASIKMAAVRLRRRFGKLLREEIAETVRGAAEVDDELRHLIGVLRGG